MAVSRAELPLSSQASDGAQVIARAGQVLRTLDREDQGLSLAQLAERIGLPRSTMHRIVTALATEGMVAIGSPGGSVRVGPEFARLASSREAEPPAVVPPFR